MKKVKMDSRRVMGVVVLLVFLDFLTKAFFKMLGVGYINTGISFSVFTGVSSVVLILAGLSICCLLVVLMMKGSLSEFSFYGVGLMLAGGLGNLVSRVVWGGVWDWICPVLLPAFNFADIWINMGCFLFVTGVLYGRRS